MKLGMMATGSRVRKLSAVMVDFAYGREGMVIRETLDGVTHLGIRWDGSHKVFEYPHDTEVEEVPNVDQQR